MRYVSIIIIALALSSCGKDSNYMEFPYQRFGKEVKTKLGTIHFAKGSYQISPAGQKDLMAIVRVLSLYERYNDKQRIRIVGYADQDGDVGLNMQLGLARAEEVGHALESYGISMSRAKIASYGESRTFVNDKTFRKVDIFLENDPWAFLHDSVFIYVTISILVSFTIGFIAQRIIRR